MYVSLGGSCSTTYHLKRLGLRKSAYPFDWSKITIKQLNNVLENDFKNYTDLEIKKWSENHKSNSQNEGGSFLLKNKYGCSFAHELVNEDNLNEFEEKMKRRIDRLKKLKNPTFIRFENSKYKKSYCDEYKKLNQNLNKIFEKYTLILILHDSYKIETNNIIYYSDFDPNWKYNNIKWNLLKNYQM